MSGIFAQARTGLIVIMLRVYPQKLYSNAGFSTVLRFGRNDEAMAGVEEK